LTFCAGPTSDHYEARVKVLAETLSKLVFDDIKEYDYRPPVPITFNNSKKGEKLRKRHMKQQLGKDTYSTVQCKSRCNCFHYFYYY
jgi:hypothetical protein